MTKSPCETCAERGTCEKGGYRWRECERWRGWFRMHWQAARRLWKKILGEDGTDG